MVSRRALLGIIVASSVGVSVAQAQPPSVPEARISQNTNGARLTAPSSASALTILGGYLRSRGHSDATVQSMALVSENRVERTGVTHLRLEQRSGTLLGLRRLREGLVDLTRRADLGDREPRRDSRRQRRSGASRRGARAGRGAAAPLRRRGRSAGARAARGRHGGLCPDTLLPQGAPRDAGRGAARRRLAGRRVPGRDVEPEGQPAASHAGRRRRRRARRGESDGERLLQRVQDLSRSRRRPDIRGCGPAATGCCRAPRRPSTSTATTSTPTSTLDANNAPDSGGAAVTNGQFVTDANLSAAPSTTDNRAVSVQNLFYLNNVIHDRLKSYGFDEVGRQLPGEQRRRPGAWAPTRSTPRRRTAAAPTTRTSRRLRTARTRGCRCTCGAASAPTRSWSAATTYLAQGASFGPASTTTGVTGPLALAGGTGRTRRAASCRRTPSWTRSRSSTAAPATSSSRSRTCRAPARWPPSSSTTSPGCRSRWAAPARCRSRR